MQFITHGRVTARFNGYSDRVARQVGSQHTGQDEVKGWGKPWIADTGGFVYKVHIPDNSFRWAAVHLLVKITEENYLEYIALGHANSIAVKEGDTVHRGQIVGTEGNHGEVYSGGRRITVEERQAGSHAGTHNHRGVRPVRRIKETGPGKFYLETAQWETYRDKEGYCYEIKINDPFTKGWIDPMAYLPSLASDRMYLNLLDAQAENNLAQIKIYGSILNLLKAFNN